ncbi:MAG: hypothetical protein JSV17_14910 [Candidatus Aminicenantes bacterium]|nr:MAG: hypothetical protein JSV17_14910 [Candidatus Aminicenantes bacterium]
MSNKIKIPLFVSVALFLSFFRGFAQENKVRVIVDRARIYAESSIDSYRIETIKKGTILTLFGAKKADEDWLYVYYQSPRWGSKVTGFIQAKMVEDFSEAERDEGKPEEIPEDKPERKPEEKQAVAEPIKKPEPKPKQPEPKEGPVRMERLLGLTAIPSHKAFPFPLFFSVGKNPRVFNVATEKALKDVVLPAGAKHAVQPKETIKTEVWEDEVVIPEKTEVTEKRRDIQKADLPEKTEQPPKKEPQIVTPKPPKTPRISPPEAKPLVTLSLGYGPSLGGFGGFIQLNASNTFSVHWGFGYYPTSMFYPEYDWVKGKPLFSVGVKYYLPWRSNQVRPYIDFQYGGISVEAVRVITGIWYYSYVYEDIQRTLWGPSLLAGIELRLGSFGLNGAVGASYVITKWEYWDSPLTVTADVGFLIFF